MAVCGICDGEMREGVSCSDDPLIIGGQPYEPIRWGKERRSSRWTIPDLCTDCGTPIGGVHHHGCCVERCPLCLGQAMWCPCIAADQRREEEEEMLAAVAETEADMSTYADAESERGHTRLRAMTDRTPRQCMAHLFLRERPV
jgi:hypothetical protein